MKKVRNLPFSLRWLLRPFPPVVSKSTGFLPPAPDETAAKGAVAKTLARQDPSSPQGPPSLVQLRFAITASALALTWPLTQSWLLCTTAELGCAMLCCGNLPSLQPNLAQRQLLWAFWGFFKKKIKTSLNVTVVVCEILLLSSNCKERWSGSNNFYQCCFKRGEQESPWTTW